MFDLMWINSYLSKILGHPIPREGVHFQWFGFLMVGPHCGVPLPSLTGSMNDMPRGSGLGPFFLRRGLPTGLGLGQPLVPLYKAPTGIPARKDKSLFLLFVGEEEMKKGERQLLSKAGFHEKLRADPYRVITGGR